MDDVDHMLHASAVPSREAGNGVLICITHINHPLSLISSQVFSLEYTYLFISPLPCEEKYLRKDIVFTFENYIMSKKAQKSTQKAEKKKEQSPELDFLNVLSEKSTEDEEK